MQFFKKPIFKFIDVIISKIELICNTFVGKKSIKYSKNNYTYLKVYRLY